MVPEFKDKQIAGESALPSPVAQLDAFGNSSVCLQDGFLLLSLSI